MTFCKFRETANIKLNTEMTSEEAESSRQETQTKAPQVLAKTKCPEHVLQAIYGDKPAPGEKQKTYENSLKK
jgi:hypothetical protein